MRKLVVQVDIHPRDLIGSHHNLTGRTRNEPLISRSKRDMKRYAQKYKADYKLIDKPKDPTKHPWCERFRIFNESYYDDYDVILYTDIDIIPKSRASNIFLLGDTDSFVAADRHRDQQWIIDLWRQHAVRAMPDVDIDKFIQYQLNSGVILIGQNTRKFIDQNMDWDRMFGWYWHDQMELSYVCMLAEEAKAFQFKRMPWVWNDDRITSRGFFHHYKGEARKRT